MMHPIDARKHLSFASLCPAWVRRAVPAVLVGALLFFVSRQSAAQAPPVTLDPSGDSPDSSGSGFETVSGAGAEGNSGAGPGNVVFASPTQQGVESELRGASDSGAAGQGYYYTDARGESGAPSRAPGNTPGVHVVRAGDTLWDICNYYFANPWEWPRIWSYNEQIANPHWIYPGDVIKLVPGGSVEPTAVVPAKVLKIETPSAPRATKVRLRQLAFVSLDDLNLAGAIVGSTEEKVMLSEGDSIYVNYPARNPPQVGRKYAIYSAQKAVVHPVTGEKVGAYVLLKGEADILSVKKDKRALGAISHSTQVIERGDRVGNMLRQFRDVTPVAADRDLAGFILATIGTDNLIGEHQIVFLDRGADQGVQVGNRFLVIRRGDAYSQHMGPSDMVGQDDRRFPDHALAQVTVVEAGKKNSVAIVDHSVQEVEVGDHVVMRKGR